MNYCWLIILLLLCESRGGGDVPVRSRRNYNYERGCGDAQPQFVSQETVVQETRYGYEQPPRGFAGFPASETCGCENSENEAVQ